MSRFRLNTVFLAGAVALLGLATVLCAQLPPSQAASEEISALVHRVDGPLFDASQRERVEVREFYDRRWDIPAWTDASDRLNSDARNALVLLRTAGLDGLDPYEYGSAALDAHAAMLDVGPRPTPAAIAAFDVRLSLGLLRYFRHLHQGRIDPRTLGVRMDVRAEEHDVVQALNSALVTHRVSEAAEALAPQLAQYRGLREGLARYRAMLAASPRDEALSRQVRQIELGLERLRWLPDLAGDRLLAVNIPMFYLWGWDSIGPLGVPAFDMKVVVGRAVRHQTPMFVSEIRQVVFRPYWNVPVSIVRAEILPALEKDTEYLRRQDMEIVRGAGDDAVPVPVTGGNLELLRVGALRLRQRPGPSNALGLIKFVLPNEESVYLHGTPVQELFSQARRDFSHGCVRVEDPVNLAEWLLDDPVEWSREQIVAAMQDRTHQVTLVRPVRVILFYTTAVFMPQDGTIHFVEDIYGHDARLDTALRGS